MREALRPLADEAVESTGGPPPQDDILLLHGRHTEPLGMDDVMQRLTALNAS